MNAMATRRHSWSQPHRQSNELTIRVCEHCGLSWHSHHDWWARSGGLHWSEYYTERQPDVKLMAMPKCES